MMSAVLTCAASRGMQGSCGMRKVLAAAELDRLDDPQDRDYQVAAQQHAELVPAPVR